MARRPYKNMSGAELSGIFTSRQGEPAQLRKLLSELKHRTTASAKALRSQVEAALTEHAAGGETPQQQLQLDVRVASERAQSKVGSAVPQDVQSRVVKCKGCGAKLRVAMKQGQHEYSCPRCDIRFDTSFESDVLEIVFSVERGSGTASEQ